MAFGRADTDAFYEDLLEPALSRNGILPIIVNRRQSNDDLNLQIIEELRRADFAVCDLTYARPSAYFEAGFAERVSPVIYTVREDHLSAGQADDLRVHFDLQMKPLITWRDPSDASFSTRIEKRLRATVLRDWHRRRVAGDALTKARTEFEHTSVAQRLINVRHVAIRTLRKAGFREWLPMGNALFRVTDILAGRLPVARSMQRAKTGMRFVTVSSFERMNRRELQMVAAGLSIERVTHGTAVHGRSASFTAQIDNYVLSLRAVPRARIESSLPIFVRDPETGSYVEKQEGDQGSLLINRWHFISPLTSEIELSQSIQETLGKDDGGGPTRRSS